ncbi:MAG: LytR/AlgR family response regulator transcription factor [Flavobacteriaceae bacterium]
MFNKSIAFTSSWYNTLIIASVISLWVVGVLVFLQPFDTYQVQDDYKFLKLVGYALCIGIPILFCHGPELYVYSRNDRKWTVGSEIISIALTFCVISMTCFIYNNIVVNNLEVRWGDFPDWILNFALPFTPVFLPLWVYLRYRFSSIVLRTPKPNREVQLKNDQDKLLLKFEAEDFLYAQAQGNYTDIYLSDQKHVVRYTLSELEKLIGQRVHRSYLVNLKKVKDLKGNSRKGYLIIEGQTEVPVSPKHFVAIKNQLQFRP